jgi:hypothetical protein
MTLRPFGVFIINYFIRRIINNEAVNDSFNSGTEKMSKK